MDNNIKSADLCGRCYYNYNSHCSGKDCMECDMRLPGSDCKCLAVKKNTPCPYFDEREVKE